MKDDKKKFERLVTQAIIGGMTPRQSYWLAEMRHKRKHGCRRYFNYEHFVRSTRIKIEI